MLELVGGATMTVFEVNGSKIKTNFGECALCKQCDMRRMDNSCRSETYPTWYDGWCGTFGLQKPRSITLRWLKAIAAEAYADGIEREAEEQGAERYREPVRDEGHD
jgi:hypothetical protein